jgi:hypothetical protein
MIYKNMKNMNFFESVAHHNLERFHSECISWAFNSSEKMLLNFLENAANHDNILDITDAEVHCERYNIDILVSYKMSDTHHFIHIENKIKANEHIIEVNPQKVEEEYNGIAKDTPLSQTQYYFVRNKAEIEKELSNGEPAKWHYLYLLPAVDDSKPKNMWDSDLIEENHWKTISYWDIINSMPIDSDNKIFADYRSYLASQFLGDDHSNPYQVEIKSENISTVAINECLKPDTKILKEYGLRLHFEAVAKELENFVKNVYPNVPFEVKFLTETGNNRGYLLEVFTTAILKSPNPTIFGKPGPIEFRIGFQFEQNKTGKGKFKYYFADLEYKAGVIKESGKEKYHESVGGTEGILNTIFGEATLEKCRKGKNKLRFNKSTSKSFCSYLIDKFSFNDKEDLQDTFKAEIKTLVDSLVKNNFKEILYQKFN